MSPSLRPAPFRPSLLASRPGPRAAALLSTLLAAAFLPALPPELRAQAGPACQAPEHRQFDFWVGTWEVWRPDGSRAGDNTIRPILGGCVLHESYSTPAGYRGESFNAWDAARGVWHQTWVDAQGAVLLLEGGRRGDSMVLEGRTPGPDGAVRLERITWTPLAEDGTRVRQLWEQSTDGGASWTVAFDGEYRRAGG